MLTTSGHIHSVQSKRSQLLHPSVMFSFWRQWQQQNLLQWLRITATDIAEALAQLKVDPHSDPHSIRAHTLPNGTSHYCHRYCRSSCHTQSRHHASTLRSIALPDEKWNHTSNNVSSSDTGSAAVSNLQAAQELAIPHPRSWATHYHSQAFASLSWCSHGGWYGHEDIAALMQRPSEVNPYLFFLWKVPVEWYLLQCGRIQKKPCCCCRCYI